MIYYEWVNVFLFLYDNKIDDDVLLVDIGHSSQVQQRPAYFIEDIILHKFVPHADGNPISLYVPSETRGLRSPLPNSGLLLSRKAQ